MKLSLNNELTGILRKLVQIPTENPPGITKEIVDYLISDVFREGDGFRNEIITHKKNNLTLHNLITKIGFGTKKIILSGHFDVVPAGDPFNWQYDPFSAEIKDNKLYGRGSTDMKGGLTMLIGVMKNLKENIKLLENYSFIFAGSADEEVGMTGASTLYKHGLMDNAELLVIAEPTNMNIGIAEKGLLWINLKIFGKAAHGAMPEKGINSILAASNLIPTLYSFLDRESNEILGSSTLNIGKIIGGTLINVVPEKTELELDFRLIPEQDPDKLIERLRNLNIEPCNFHCNILKKLPALQSNINHPFIQTLCKISGKKPVGLAYATDAAHLLTQNNTIPFIIFGPGNPNVVHSTDEYIELDSVFKSSELLTETILQTYS
ncbi:MAG: M20 family metallopeptidase [Promethearchaeota archaeon]